MEPVAIVVLVLLVVLCVAALCSGKRKKNKKYYKRQIDIDEEERANRSKRVQEAMAKQMQAAIQAHRGKVRALSTDVSGQAVHISGLLGQLRGSAQAVTFGARLKVRQKRTRAARGTVGVLEVLVKRGVGLKAADPNGKADPYVIVHCGRQQKKTCEPVSTIPIAWLLRMRSLSRCCVPHRCCAGVSSSET